MPQNYIKRYGQMCYTSVPMELHALTGHINIIAGEQQASAAPGLIAQPAPRKANRSRTQDFLFVHLTLSDPPPAEVPDVLTQDLVEALMEHFYAASGSVTSALRQAIMHINTLLLRWNVTTSTRSREGAVSCAVLRGDELFVVQVGEALALVGHNFGMERMPAKEPERITPLGRSAGLDFRFGHFRLQPGDMLLLADPEMAAVATPAFQPALVDTEVELGLQELIDLIGNGTGRCLLVEFTDEDAIAFPETAAAIVTEIPPTEKMAQTQPVGGLARVTTTVGLPLKGFDRTAVEVNARRGAAQAAHGLSKLTGGMADVLGQIRPLQERPPEAEKPGLFMAGVIAVIIPIVIAAIVMGAYFQWGRVSRFSDINQEISAALALAAEAETPDVARSQFNRVLQLAAEAETLRPGDAEIERQRAIALEQLDRLDAITRLRGRTFFEYDAATRLASIALGDPLNGDIYVLDIGNNRVLRHVTDESYLNLLEEEPQEVLFSGQAVQDHVAGSVVDIMWRPRGSAVTRDGLAMLDSRGALITFFENFGDTRAAQLPLASDWRSPTQIVGFSERLYILDREAEQIWRYLPDGDSFSVQENDRTVTFFDPIDLINVVDLAINQDDGSVLLLFGDGRLRRYANGRAIWTEANLADGGLSSPMVRPVSLKIIGQGLNSSIFVLDPGSGRLLQFSLGGTLLAQYRSTDDAGLELFTRATDFYVAEDPLRVFVTADNRLYLAMLE